VYIPSPLLLWGECHQLLLLPLQEGKRKEASFDVIAGEGKGGGSIPLPTVVIGGITLTTVTDAARGAVGRGILQCLFVFFGRMHFI
jgi:hypothetical protein